MNFTRAIEQASSIVFDDTIAVILERSDHDLLCRDIITNEIQTVKFDQLGVKPTLFEFTRIKYYGVNPHACKSSKVKSLVVKVDCSIQKFMFNVLDL